MAYTYQNTFDGVLFTYRYDLYPVEIEIVSTVDKVYIITLFNSIRDAECSEVGRVYPHLCTSDGRVTLQIDGDGELTTDLTITLLNGTIVNALKESGKFYIKGGNLVPDYENSFTEIVKENSQLTYIVNLSQTGVIATVSTGSGLSVSEHDQLMATLREDRFKPLTYNIKTTQIASDQIAQYTVNNEITVDVTRNGAGVPLEEKIQ